MTTATQPENKLALLKALLCQETPHYTSVWTSMMTQCDLWQRWK